MFTVSFGYFLIREILYMNVYNSESSSQSEISVVYFLESIHRIIVSPTHGPKMKILKI